MTNAETPKPRIAISVERKINLGNYESATVFLSLSDLTAETTEAEMLEALETQMTAYQLLKERIKAFVQDTKNSKGVTAK